MDFDPIEIMKCNCCGFTQVESTTVVPAKEGCICQPRERIVDMMTELIDKGIVAEYRLDIPPRMERQEFIEQITLERGAFYPLKKAQAELKLG